MDAPPSTQFSSGGFSRSRILSADTMLKEMRKRKFQKETDLSDETMVERWVENHYFQFFSGESVSQWNFPCHPTDLVYFRKRIGEEGVEKILKVSIELHGKRDREKEVLVDHFSGENCYLETILEPCFSGSTI